LKENSSKDPGNSWPRKPVEEFERQEVSALDEKLKDEPSPK